MRVLGRLALAALAAFAFAIALSPALAIAMLGTPSVTRAAADPALRSAAIGSLQAAVIVLAIGWPTGVLAAFGIWGARPAPRRTVLGTGLLALLIAAALSGRVLPGPVASLILPAAAGSALVLLAVTGALNTIDPRMLQTAAACGARPFRTWLAILAAIRPTLILAAATAFAAGLALCPRISAGPTLAGVIWQATRQADVRTAPDALLLAMLSLLPLLLAGFLVLPGRAFRRS